MKAQLERWVISRLEGKSELVWVREDRDVLAKVRMSVHQGRV